jgi:hypothetical protein
VTPSSLPAGLVHEWLRSCSRSKWQFFNPPGPQTQGYYYRAASGTGHAQTPHNFGSRIWTSEEGMGALGEQPPPPGRAGRRGGRGRSGRGYSKGGLPFSVPPGKQYGSNNETTYGSRYPHDVVSRRLPLGIDGRLWTDIGLSLPNFPDSGSMGGNLLWGGQANVNVGPVPAAIAGLLFDGSAVLAGVAGKGGLLWDGHATHSP